MKHDGRVVYGGVDTHQDVHVAAVIDDVGMLLGTKSFPTTPLGLKGLQRWLVKHGRVVKVGVEGTGHATAAPKGHDGIVESIRVLLVTYRSRRRSLHRIGGQLRSLIVTAPESLRVEFVGASAQTIATKASRLRPGDDCSSVLTATKTSLRLLARQYQALSEDLRALEAELETLTTRANPGQPGHEAGARRRPDRGSQTIGRSRRHSRPAHLRRRVRRALRGLPGPGFQRQDHRQAAEPRR